MKGLVVKRLGVLRRVLWLDLLLQMAVCFGLFQRRTAPMVPVSCSGSVLSPCQSSKIQQRLARWWCRKSAPVACCFLLCWKWQADHKMNAGPVLAGGHVLRLVTPLVHTNCLEKKGISIDTSNFLVSVAGGVAIQCSFPASPRTF